MGNCLCTSCPTCFAGKPPGVLLTPARERVFLWRGAVACRTMYSGWLTLARERLFGSWLQPDLRYKAASPHVLSDGLLAGGDGHAKRKLRGPDGSFAEPGW